jgi:hypothetical protein
VHLQVRAPECAQLDFETREALEQMVGAGALRAVIVHDLESQLPYPGL